MSNSKRIILILGAVLLTVALGCIFFLTHKKVEAPTTPNEGSSGSAIITYTDTGFSPASITILVGTTVTWSNESSRDLWVYPSDDGEDYCLGQDAPTSFNQCASIEKGSSYSHTFTTARTYTYVNHENLNDTGEIRVRKSVINPDAIPQ